MQSNFSLTASRNVVQRTLTFEPGERKLYGLPLLAQGLSFRCVEDLSIGCPELLVMAGDVHYWDSPVLAFDMAHELPTSIASVSHEVSGMEPLIGHPALPERVSGPCHIMNIARAHMRSDGQLTLAVHYQMQLPAINKLFRSLCTLLNTPSRFGVSFGVFTAVRPSPQSRGIEGYTFAESRQHFVMLSNKLPRDVLNKVQILRRCQPLVETRERGLVGNGIGRINPTYLSNKRVVLKSTNHRVRGSQAKHMLGNEAAPEGSDRMAFRAASRKAYKGIEQGGIVKVGEYCLKLPNNGRRLHRRLNDGIISENHREAETFLVARSRRVLTHLAALLYLEQLYYALHPCVKPKHTLKQSISAYFRRNTCV